MSIAEKIILITDATEGLGRECAIRLARNGAHIAIGGYHVNDLFETAHQIEAFNGRVLPVPANFEDERDIRNLFRHITVLWGKLDGIFINFNPSPSSDRDDTRHSTQSHIKRTLAFSNIAIPYMSEGACMVFMSDEDMLNTPFENTEQGTVDTLANYTHQLAKRLTAHNISVNTMCISPDNNLLYQDFDQGNNTDASALKTHHTPDEFIGYLLSDSAKGITDQRFWVSCH